MPFWIPQHQMIIPVRSDDKNLVMDQKPWFAFVDKWLEAVEIDPKTPIVPVGNVHFLRKSLYSLFFFHDAKL